jgi:methionyl-tRNA formyltransferase
MKIIFMGTPDFAVPSLEILLTSHHELSAVVTAPDKPQGRGLKLGVSPVKKYAVENHLNILEPPDLKDSKFIDVIVHLNPDLIVVVAFRILPKEIFTVPKFGTFNLHASLLPKYRGAAPINWAIINGESETGVTTFFLDEKVDTGNIIMQNKCEITEDDNAGTLHDKLAVLGARTVLSTVSLIEMTNGNVPVYTQDESLFTKAPKIFKEFCEINWDNSVNTIHNFIRGLSPIPTAYTFHDSKLIKIYKSAKCLSSTITLNNTREPGKLVKEDNKLFVCCNDGLMEIKELQIEGKNRMHAEEFLRGHKLQSGDVFGKLPKYL